MNATAAVLRRLASLARRRLVWAAWWHGAARSALPLAAASTTLAALHHWTTLLPWLLPAQIVVLSLWAIIPFGLAWWRRPGPLEALATWDERADHHEMLVSAWCFAQAEERTAGQRLHLERVEARLAQVRRSTRQHLPVPWSWRLGLPPVLVVIALILPHAFQPSAADHDRIASEARRRAGQQARRVQDEAKTIDTLKDVPGLDPKALDKLQAELEKTARKLDDPEALTRRELLEELEQRAREAEKLAELAANALDKLSPELLAALAKAADLAALAEALKAKDPAAVAEAAKKLADQLKAKDLTREQAERLRRQLEEALKAAKPEDLDQALTKALAEARDALGANDPGAAAEALARLADGAQRQGRLANARRQLQRMAENLRGAGQRIFAPGHEGMERLDEDDSLSQTQSGLSGDDLMQYFMPRSGNQPGRSHSSFSGLNPNRPGQRCRNGGVPGSGQPGENGEGEGNGSVLVDPNLIPGVVEFADPIPGQTEQQGSNSAGVGSAPYRANPTLAREATRTGTTQAQMSGDGPSMTRETTGVSHRDEARRQASSVGLRQLQIEEQALAAEPIPLARRAQVLAYFTLIRRHLEQQP